MEIWIQSINNNSTCLNKENNIYFLISNKKEKNIYFLMPNKKNLHLKVTCIRINEGSKWLKKKYYWVTCNPYQLKRLSLRGGWSIWKLSPKKNWWEGQPPETFPSCCEENNTIVIQNSLKVQDQIDLGIKGEGKTLNFKIYSFYIWVIWQNKLDKTGIWGQKYMNWLCIWVYRHTSISIWHY